MGDSPVQTADRSAMSAVGRVLAAISGSGFELQPALDQIAAEARVLCGADASFCHLREGDVFRFAAASGGDPAHWAYDSAHPDPIDRRSIVGRVALARGPVQIPDLAADNEYDAGAYTVGGYRTLLGVPIGTPDDLIGAFGLGRFDVAPFTEDEIALVSVFADQAAVAIRLARLLSEANEAVERDAAIRDVLQSINRSTFDLTAILQTVIDRAVQICRADQGNIVRQDGDVYRVTAHSGLVAPEYLDMVMSREYRPERGSVIGRAVLERRLVHIADILEDPEYELRDVQAAAGYRTILGLPMLHDGVPIGVLVLWRLEVRPFSDAEIRLLATFAEQAALAIRLAGVLGETQEALERESAIGQVLASIARSSFDLHGVLQTVIDSATRLTRADDGNIVREEGGVFRVAAYTAGVPESFQEIINKRAFKAERSSAMGRALLEQRPVQIVDVLADPEYTLLDAQRASGFRTLLGIPLMSEGAPIGVLAVWRTRVEPFSDAEISLLSTFADQAALAISNVRLFETVERQRTELARFAPQVAGLLSTEEGEALLAGHRREISALFCDLRGFTPFAETAEPEELFSVLRQYHAAVGEIAVANGGTVEHFAGDGLMIFFNDPTPLPAHQLASVRTAIALRARFDAMAGEWHKRGYELGLGVGIAVGYATLGRIGFEGRYDYGGVGVVVTLASRLSDAAAPGEILISQRAHATVEENVEAEIVEGVSLKGFRQPVTAYRVTGLRGERAN
ncbi:MAG TPA: GAF domain-containing protein [Candidatus Limnocylindria bacterium]